MIEASFEPWKRTAAASGVYQYDTGQRLKMHGLPSPDEFLSRDSLLSGEMAAVQVQFAYDGDSQTEPRLAVYDEADGAWLAEVPDEYLTRHEDVHVYVSIYYGADESGERLETQYEACFRPISRPAPNNTATDDQWETWENLEYEVEMALTSAKTAADGAQAAAQTAQEAAKTANEEAQAASDSAETATDAADQLRSAGGVLAGMRFVVVDLEPDAQATAVRSGGTTTLGIPRGTDGQEGAQGETGPSDITLSFSDGVLTITPK